MPAHYVIDLENHIVLTIFRGVLTLTEAAELSARLDADPAFAPDFSELIDFGCVSEVQMGYSEFRSLQAIDPFSTNSKRAFVIGSSSSVYGIARLYQTMRGANALVEIFKTIEEAMRWLASTEQSSTSQKDDGR